MSRIQASVELLAETLQGKNQDYAGMFGEFYNFQRSAEFVNISTDRAIFVEIAKKMTRLENLLKLMERGVLPSNESIKDTLLDLAGYAVIGHAWVTDRTSEDAIDAVDWRPVR